MDIRDRIIEKQNNLRTLPAPHPCGCHFDRECLNGTPLWRRKNELYAQATEDNTLAAWLAYDEADLAYWSHFDALK